MILNAAKHVGLLSRRRYAGGTKHRNGRIGPNCKRRIHGKWIRLNLHNSTNDGHQQEETSDHVEHPRSGWPTRPSRSPDSCFLRIRGMNGSGSTAKGTSLKSRRSIPNWKRPSRYNAFFVDADTTMSAGPAAAPVFRPSSDGRPVSCGRIWSKRSSRSGMPTTRPCHG